MSVPTCRPALAIIADGPDRNTDPVGAWGVCEVAEGLDGAVWLAAIAPNGLWLDVREATPATYERVARRLQLLLDAENEPRAPLELLS